MFVSNLMSASELNVNIMMRYHTNLMVQEIDNIINLLSKQNVSEGIKENLIKLGNGLLKQEYMKVYA